MLLPAVRDFFANLFNAEMPTSLPVQFKDSFMMCLGRARIEVSGYESTCSVRRVIGANWKLPVKARPGPNGALVPLPAAMDLLPNYFHEETPTRFLVSFNKSLMAFFVCARVDGFCMNPCAYGSSCVPT